MAGELSGGELRRLYSKDFVIFEAESPHLYKGEEPLGKLTSRRFTPVWVFLDPEGKKVLENTGFRTPREARALHRFVTTRAYRKTSYEQFLNAFPKDP